MAGITVASELRRVDVAFTWVEADERAGGALHRVFNPLFGWPEGGGRSGVELAAALEASEACAGLERGCKVASIEATAGGLKVALERAAAAKLSQAVWSRVVLCTGTRPRRWEVPGAADLWGRGVELSTHGRGAVYAGEPVAVVGGGDAAVEGALRMAAKGSAVWLIVRGASLRASARFVEALAAMPAVEVRYRCEVTEVIAGSQDKLSEVALSDGERLQVRGLFVRVGVDPVLPPIAPAPALDGGGYLCVDSEGLSSLPGLYGAGEVTSPEVSQLRAVTEQALRVARAVCAGR
jgi:thioredoxin reductase